MKRPILALVAFVPRRSRAGHPTYDRSGFTADVTNPWFPLPDRVLAGGVVRERTTDYYAQDA